MSAIRNGKRVLSAQCRIWVQIKIAVAHDFKLGTIFLQNFIAQFGNKRSSKLVFKVLETKQIFKGIACWCHIYFQKNYMSFPSTDG